MRSSTKSRSISLQNFSYHKIENGGIQELPNSKNWYDSLVWLRPIEFEAKNICEWGLQISSNDYQNNKKKRPKNHCQSPCQLTSYQRQNQQFSWKLILSIKWIREMRKSLYVTWKKSPIEWWWCGVCKKLFGSLTRSRYKRLKKEYLIVSVSNMHRKIEKKLAWSISLTFQLSGK